MRRLVGVLCLLCMALASCGLKGDPHPPERTATESEN